MAALQLIHLFMRYVISSLSGDAFSGFYPRSSLLDDSDVIALFVIDGSVISSM